MLARDQLLDADPTKTLLQHNEAKWKLMRDGITLKSPTGNAAADVHVTVIDFTQPENNDFLVVRELWVQSGPFRRRCDLVGFVNGLPLVFIELKRHDKGLKAAFDDNYTDYKDTIPRLFHYNALVIVSNGFDARFGSITSTWDHFYRWKRLKEEDPDPAPKHDEAPLKPILPILLRGMCTKGALLDIVANFILFDSSEEVTLKVVARNHQYIGVNKAIARLKAGDAEVMAGKLGVFWHTQGSGKSYSMVFFCQKVHRRVSSGLHLCAADRPQRAGRSDLHHLCWMRRLDQQGRQGHRCRRVGASAAGSKPPLCVQPDPQVPQARDRALDNAPRHHRLV